LAFFPLRHGISAALFETHLQKDQNFSAGVSFHKPIFFSRGEILLRNADGFGVGWYAQQAPLPCVFTSLKPDPCLRLRWSPEAHLGAPSRDAETKGHKS
jgi:hypothetical protein